MASHYQSSGTVNWQATGTSSEGTDSEEDDGNFWDVDIREKECWLFDTASGCFYACNGRGISIGQRPTFHDGWHEPGGVPDSGFVKDGSVIRMEYGGDGAGTIVIYVDGRRLGLLFSQWDLDLGDGDIPPLPIWPLGFKWCGVLSAGAELRISGPKLPASG